jgi:hypothetical protein
MIAKKNKLTPRPLAVVDELRPSGSRQRPVLVAVVLEYVLSIPPATAPSAMAVTHHLPLPMAPVAQHRYVPNSATPAMASMATPVPSLGKVSTEGQTWSFTDPI